MTKYIFTFIAFIFISNAFSQSELNQYKYVVVPKTYKFLKEADKHQLNSLTKFLIEKEGFTALFDDEALPEDLAQNRCLASFVSVIEDSGMFKTKLTVELKNCKNETLFTTKTGESRSKDYKTAFHEALRDAFTSFSSVSYNYKPLEKEKDIVQIFPKKEILKQEKISTPKKTKVLTVKKRTPLIKSTEIKEIKPNNVLYAQAINKGFQLVDNTPKVVMILFDTPKQDVFIVKGNDAIVYKEDGFWYLSENNGEASNLKTLDIKF